MTENEKSDLLNSNYLNISETLTSDTLTAVSQLDNTLFIGTNMAIGAPCLYAALPAEIANNYPEGTVLQILSEAPLLTVPPTINTTMVTSTSSTAVSSLSSFSAALLDEQNSSLPNLLVNSNQCGTQEGICSEGNMSDIDLSFLNDTEEPVSTSKDLNDAQVKELQSMIDIVEPNSLGIMQNNPSHLINAGLETEQAKSHNPKPTEGAGDVVVIDVSKPIQLSQNSLIKVNGQKCVLQQDPETGQVIAYPVKDPDKSHRKRGRPKRKISTDQNDKNASLSSECVPAAEASDEEQEKGLLEVVNDDGSLVRRSSRKRKKARVLRDYETGNLKQELGSDVEDSNLYDDTQLQFRRRRPKGPGRPRKLTPQHTSSTIFNDMRETSLNKRPRGRPRKQILEKEPTQAFLVQTADGQTLMMQVPLSSIPAGVSLQDVAQSIANRLNTGLSMANNNLMATLNESANSKSGNSNLLLNGEGISTSENTPEPVVQDHSVGSTTNFSSADQSIEERLSSEQEHNSCSNVMSQIEETIVCSSDHSRIISQDAINDNKSDSFIPENLLKKHFPNIDAGRSDNTFSTNIPTTLSLTNNSSILTSLPELCVNQKPEQDLVSNLTPEHFTKDFLLDGDFLKDKVNLQFLLQNVETSEDTVPNFKTQAVNSIPDQEDICLDSTQPFVSISSHSVTEKKDTPFTVSNITKLPDTDTNLIVSVQGHDYSNHDTAESNFHHNIHSDEISRKHAIISSIEHDHDFLFQTKTPPISENLTSSATELTLTRSSVDSKMQHLEQILPLDDLSTIFKVSTITEKSASTLVTQSSTATVIPVTEEEKDQEIISITQDEVHKKCKICRKIFSTEDELISHFKSDHPKCICNECNYMAEHSYVVKRHALRHMNAGCVCKLCGKRYKDHYILKMHIKMVHLPAETMYTCEICNKKFTRKAHLKRHLRIHEPDRPYKCSFCEYRGCERSDITKHLLVHETPKHKCHLCGKIFRHTKNIELHLKRHYKQRDYKCGICDFYGYTFTDIRKHIERRHTGLSSSSSDHACPNCGLVFSSKEILETHKSNGSCQICNVDQELATKEVVISTDAQKHAYVTLLENIPLNILEEPEQSEIGTLKMGSSEVKLRTDSVVLNNVDDSNIPAEQQLVINGFETSDLLSSDAISLLSVDKDPSKLVPVTWFPLQ
ncbi:uncharacterized protein [Parasteatoda tepidariorum]|uniref:uncharacterized protein isoform X2 n=1 Tax=Parasteatoda tepidariorum TaxID=114398 RepID=UPI0039BCA63B